jgi:hypothetical protein
MSIVTRIKVTKYLLAASFQGFLLIAVNLSGIWKERIIEPLDAIEGKASTMGCCKGFSKSRAQPQTSFTVLKNSACPNLPRLSWSLKVTFFDM